MHSAAPSVLVIGGGPIGLALAGDLGWRGVRCTLVEKDDGTAGQPKMDMVGIRSMEFCRRWGIVDWVESAGYNRDYPQDCAWVTDLNGYEFGREPFPPPSQEKPPSHSPQKRERCPQNFFDPVLQRFARRSPTVALEFNTELIDFEARDDHVEAVLRDTRTGDARTMQASYLVGCDGGASKVRQSLGIEMAGDPVLTHTTNIVFRCAGLERLHDKKPAYRFIFIGREGTWATLVAINGHDQWRFSLIGDAEKRTLTEAEARAAIVRAVGRPFQFEILSMLPWVRRQLVARRYGKGRIFIAGDAAHLTSPTGGFGMNTGLLDAVNLSWKLAAVLEGWGGEHLLASYEVEQLPVAVRNVGEATENLRRMLSPRILKPAADVFEGNGAEAQAARHEYGRRYTEMMRREWFSIGVHLGYVYEGSPIVIPDGTPRPPLQTSSYTPTSRPGSRAPHAWIGEGKSTLDLFGKAFVMLRFGARPPEVDALVQAAGEIGMPLEVVDLIDEAAAKLYERRFVLVRPDGQVAWRGDALPDDMRDFLDVVRGAKAGRAAPISFEAVIAEAWSTMGDQQRMSDESARIALKDDLARFNCRVQQPDDPPLFTRSPQSAMQTIHWKWSDLEPLLDRLGRQLSLEPGGSRRTLRLHNPGLAYGTTPTFWASIQVILPGEIAGNHRHTANAFRFIMRGKGATTTVNGERYPMNEGDLVLTPGMSWHDHQYQGDEPMIWLDVLDISLMKALHATFFEASKELQQGVNDVADRSWRQYGSGLMSPPGGAPPGGANPLLVYPRAVAEAALEQAGGLEPDPFDDVILEYRNPVNGGPAMTTLGMRLQKMRPGVHTRARRHTGSKLYYAVRGRGTTIVDGQTFEWSAGDFLAVKPWAWHEHVNRSPAEAVLFQVNDIPALSALGYYIDEAHPGDGRQQPTESP